MKKEYEKNKKLVVIILAVAAVCLAGGLCLYLAKLGTPAQADAKGRQETTEPPEVTVPEISSPEQTPDSKETAAPEESTAPEETAAPKETAVPEENGNGGAETEPSQSMEPSSAGSQADGEPAGEGSEPPKTREDAQAPTEKPEPAGGDAAGNPEQPPQYEPEVTEPEQKPEEPAGGIVNENGQVYVPGFGYVDPPGAAQGESAGSNGDWDKQIGDMN